MTQFKGLRQGQSISASEYTGLGRSIAGAHGTGAARVSMVNGRLQVHVPVPVQSSPHPFKISAEFDNPAAPTICLVNIAPGTLTGQISGAGSYTGNPLFEGSGGATLASDPTYNVGVTEQTTYFYLNVTTDNEGKIKNCWIDAIVAADVATTAVDVPYVQEDFPAVGDPGSDGTYFHPIGRVTVSVSGSFPDFVYTVSTNNTLQSSAVFWPCGGAGIFDGFGVA